MYLGRPILVGIPLKDDYKIDARLSDILRYWEQNNEKIEVYHPTAGSPEEGRDKIVYYAKYRLPSPTHILFLDADISIRKRTLDKLMELDKDIVMGVYPMVQSGHLSWNVSRTEPFTPLEINDLPRNPFKIKSGGFGATLVKYEVFEKLGWPYWKTVYQPGGIETGEDVYFCSQARKAGFEIWCHPVIKCLHIRITNLLSIVNSIKKEKNNGTI